MRYQRTLILVGVLGTSLLLGACAAGMQPEPTATATVTYAPTWTPMNPPYDPALEPTLTPTTEPTEEVAIDHCVVCHTDKEQLISTAKAEEPAEAESEGVG